MLWRYKRYTVAISLRKLTSSMACYHETSLLPTKLCQPAYGVVSYEGNGGSNLQLLSGLQNLLEGIERVFHSNWVSFSKAEVVIRCHQDPKCIIGRISTVTSYFSCSTKQVANFFYPTGTFSSSMPRSLIHSWKAISNSLKIFLEHCAAKIRIQQLVEPFDLRPW